jgi:hypothetical protein
MTAKRQIFTANEFCEIITRSGDMRGYGKYIVMEEISLLNCRVLHDIYIGDAIFEKTIRFNKCFFQKKFISKNVTFNDGFVCIDSIFVDDVDFSNSKVSDFSFDDSTFCKAFYCTNVKCLSDFSAENTQFHDDLIVQGSVFGRDFILDQATIQGFDCVEASFNGFSCCATEFKGSFFPLGAKFKGFINAAHNHSIGMAIYFQQRGITFTSDNFK